MKRTLSLMLSLIMLLSLAACGAPAAVPEDTQPPAPVATDTPETLPAPTAEPEPEPGFEDSEVAKAISLGLVPEEIQSDLDATITFRQYSKMLTNLIRIWDESRLPEWEQTIAAAAASDEEMRREDGILEIAYAMALMGENEPDGFFDLMDEELMRIIQEESQDGPSWEYPLFPNWEDVGFEWCGSNYMWGGYQTCAIKVSKASLQPIFPFDEDNRMMHFQDPLTRREAICAALRLAEIEPEILEPEGVYLSVDDVGGYDKSIITDALLNAPTELPTPTQASLTADWKGAGLSGNKDGRHTYRDFRETDVKFLADNGFNFTRLFLGFSTLRYPDFPEDMTLVNENELRDLDQLIAWGIQYGVHIQISMIDTPNGEESLDCDDAEWANIRAYWTMLARRYAGIPSTYISFDLCNEIEPDDANKKYAKEQLSKMVDAIRAADPQRVLLYSFSGNPNMAWVEATASLGLAIGCHPYYPQYITTSGWEYAEQNPYAEPVWPLPWLPRDQIANGRAPLAISGAIGGSKLSVHFRCSSDNAYGEIYADGALLTTLDLNGGTLMDGEYFHFDRIYTADIPADAKMLEIWVRKGYGEIDTVILEGAHGKTVIMPHDICDYPDLSAEPLPLIVNADGTYTNSENRIIDGEGIYLADVLPYLEVAQKHGVGFMVNEFGIFGSNVYWDSSIVCAYHDSVLRMLEEHGIGWCYCELYNPVPKHLVMYNRGEFQWANTTEEEITVTCDSGETREYIVNRELLDVFLKYTME